VVVFCGGLKPPLPKKLWKKVPSKLAKIPNYWTGRIAPDERVVFFPTASHQVNATHWSVPIHGWIFEPELDSKKRQAFVKSLGRLVFPENTSRHEKETLKRRILPFVADNQSKKYVTIRFEGVAKIHKLPRSAKDGHFETTLVLHRDDLLPSNREGTSADGGDMVAVPFEALNANGRSFAGVTHLVPPTGVSVISDIDDTVKITNYLDKKKFLQNTFVRDFCAVPGMPEAYRKLVHDCDNVAVHYVSASPYQLYEELEAFFKDASFPATTSVHLKRIRVKDPSVLRLLQDPLEYKLGQIEPLLEAFPDRTFVLVGDTGEKDPEVYARLCRSHPESRIRSICLRNVDGSTAKRMEDLLGENSPTAWEYFEDGSDFGKGFWPPLGKNY